MVKSTLFARSRESPSIHHRSRFQHGNRPSVIKIQRNFLLHVIRETAAVNGDWKVLVLDKDTRKLLLNVATEDTILKANLTHIEDIENKRPIDARTDAVYLLTPLQQVVECLKADIGQRRYRKYFLIWTSPPASFLQEQIYSVQTSRDQVVSQVLDIDFFATESNLVLFQEPWSFYTLFHPGCSPLVPAHLESLTRKIVSVCVSLGENPVVKYYRPKDARHESSVLCSYLAGYVQKALDRSTMKATTPPLPSRPTGVLIITDRTMDLMSPLVHEFTYQAMAMDLLPIREDEGKLMYRNIIKKGTPEEEERDVEINEDDKIWVSNRHLHMKDLLGKIVNDFNKFRADNPQFADMDDAPTSVNTIKDMIAGLPQFQQGKEAFALHLDMAEKCVKIFQERKLPDIASVEQSLATGLDEDYRKPKHLADQIVRLLDDDSVVHEDRLRLLIMYVLYRNGVLGGDIEKLRQHGQLSPMDGEIIYNFDLLGARVERPLKEASVPMQHLFPVKVPSGPQPEDNSLSRFEPSLRRMLEEQSSNILDPTIFPSVRPHLEEGLSVVAQTSLRTANKPTWAQSRPTTHAPRQRIIVFMAGGATYAEARVCYEASAALNKDIYLATSHMLTPKTFLRQVGMLSSSRKHLNLPVDAPKPPLPAWVTAKEAPRRPSQPSTGSQPGPARPTTDPRAPPINSMQNLNLSSRPASTARPESNSIAQARIVPGVDNTSGTLRKDKKEKKHFGFLKKH